MWFRCYFLTWKDAVIEKHGRIGSQSGIRTTSAFDIGARGLLEVEIFEETVFVGTKS